MLIGASLKMVECGFKGICVSSKVKVNKLSVNLERVFRSFDNVFANPLTFNGGTIEPQEDQNNK